MKPASEDGTVTHAERVDSRRRRGAYYTPEDVARFIVTQTLYPYVAQEGYHASQFRMPVTSPPCLGDGERALQVLDDVRIVDPACGLGVFLVSALEELFSLKERLLYEMGERCDPYEVKRGIVERNLFGVDIEESVLDVARSRLWLAVGEKNTGGMTKNVDNIRLRNSLTSDLESEFDIVIGNPPYVEVPQKDRNPFESYRTRACGNTHAYFFEKALHLVRRGGFCGFIVPLSTISTDRMKDVQQLLMEESSHVRVSNYDDRPGRLFRLEHCRSSIVIVRKKMGNEGVSVFTTKYHRWYTKERSSLFEGVSYVDSTDFVVAGSIPKIGTEVEKSILRKMSKEQKVVTYLGKGGTKIWYHNAPQYWVRALDFIPYFENERGGQHTSSQLVELHVEPAYRKVVAAVLNSSLFYWFFIVYSDGRHLTRREIENFPLSVGEIPGAVVEGLEDAFDRLMEDYKKNAERKVCQYKTTGRVEYEEFNPGLSKGIMDEIDDLLAGYYGFTVEERDFIVHFDRTFRLGPGSGIK